MRFPPDRWALVLGGSSGFGLATAEKLARHGMNLFLVHRDRRGSMARIDTAFARLRDTGATVVTANADALDPAVRGRLLDELAAAMAPAGRLRLLLHSIAFGNLKLVVPPAPANGAAGERGPALAALARSLAVDEARLTAAVDELFEAGQDAFTTLAAPPAYGTTVLDEEDLARTIHAMGTSLLGWTQAVLARELCGDDTRVIGLTSEGNQVAWRGYAAVAAAKVALESVSRAMALELAPHGVRCNVVQAGITETPALRVIPGSAHLKAQARLRNPFGRLTSPEDVANVICLLATDEAAWINGEVIRVDGGEHIAGAIA